MLTGKRVLITGASGILGSYILSSALSRGCRPVVLMRDSSPAAARARLQQVLELTGHEERLEEVEILHADIRERLLSAGHQQVRRLRENLDAAIHCAASVSFEHTQRDLIWDTNVRGTLNVLELLTHTGTPLYYVSTAYVAGAREGVAYEHELDEGQEFNNLYEQSKVHCERLVQRMMHTGAIHGAIFRPSIIVGAAQSGRIVQFLNFYAFMRLIDAAATGRVHVEGRARFPMAPGCTKNLVPVDWTAEALWTILEREGPSGMVYHLTNPAPPTQREILEWANEQMTEGASFEAVPWPFPEPTRLERMAARQLSAYQNYLLREATFDRTNTDRALAGNLPFPSVGPRFFDRLLAYARARRWKKLFTEPAAPVQADPAPDTRIAQEAMVQV